ncbi:MAG TPA: sulfatase [Planctomycetes bacterium]|nr:sulfatase [Verrucomicrobiales bacterium]HIM30106.1 sulfatase [Planctomycetota bacterium]
MIRNLIPTVLTLIFVFLILPLVGKDTVHVELPVESKAIIHHPNIIVILADDLGCRDVSLYGGWVNTPRIDQMAREGLMFTDFHVNSSVCSPTRAAFLTGRYQQRYGIVDVIVGSREPDQGLLPSVTTIPRVFKDNGYATALYGKWHLGFQDEYNPIKHGFDEFIGFLNGACDYHNHSKWRNGVKIVDIKGYTTHIVTDKSIDFIKRNKDKPFFLHMSHAAVHNPYQTAADTPDKRKKRRMPRTVSRPKYKNMLEELDASVGRVLDTLLELKIEKKTFVIFLSDNGDVGMSPKKPRRFRGTKFSLYEGGARVPAVMWWPGQIDPGTVSDELVLGMDLFPTFTDIAGISKSNPENLDGISAKDHVLKQKDFPDRDIFFGYEPKLGTAMRRGNWKMIIKEDKAQLYDLNTNLIEDSEKNLVDKEPKIAAEMKAAIEKWKKDTVNGS